MRIFLATLFFIISVPVFAWDSAGHRIIAQIAYDQLTPYAKKHIDALTTLQFHSPYPNSRFLKASSWPDQLKSQTKQYNTWHFIDIPYVQGQVKPPPLHAENVVWAILRAEKIVADKSNADARRAKYLSFLIHFVGDIHQPLHCVTLYSVHFPTGDQGGNLYPITSPIAHNLHALWDRGLGLFISPPHHYQFHYDQVARIATIWMAQYPRTFFGDRFKNLSPLSWAHESRHIAVTFAYTVALSQAPSTHYIAQGQVIVRTQIVLAGDRLADILNTLFQPGP